MSKVSLMAEFKAAQQAMGEDMTEETQARFYAIKRQLEKIDGEDVEFETTLP